MAYKVSDFVKFGIVSVASAGAGAITPGAAASGFRALTGTGGAGWATGDYGPFSIVNPTTKAWERSALTLQADGTLARTLKRSSTGSLLALDGTEIIASVPGEDDFLLKAAPTAQDIATRPTFGGVTALDANNGALLSAAANTFTGVLNLSGQPGYSAYGWASDSGTWRHNEFLNFDGTKQHDVGPGWDSTNKKWVAPAAGVYDVSAAVQALNQASISTGLAIYKNGGQVIANTRSGSASSPGDNLPLPVRHLVPLAAGDYLQFYIAASSGVYGCYSSAGAAFHNCQITKIK